MWIGFEPEISGVAIPLEALSRLSYFIKLYLFCKELLHRYLEKSVNSHSNRIFYYRVLVGQLHCHSPGHVVLKLGLEQVLDPLGAGQADQHAVSVIL